MQGWQERVVVEKEELERKIAALYKFVNGVQFNRLQREERFRLTTQLAVMHIYSDILGERIVHFE